MTGRRGRLRPLALAAALPLLGSLGGCFAYSAGQYNTDHQPTVDTGVGAAIIMPGQTAPAMPQQSPGAGAAASAPPPEGSAPSGAAPGGPRMATIGGAKQDEKRNLQWREEPIWNKYLMLPFAWVAAPFAAWLVSAVRGG